MPEELKFDRARWEAGEMPALRNGWKVLSLHYDIRGDEFLGIVEAPARLTTMYWGDGGRYGRCEDEDEISRFDLVHAPRVARVRTVWHRCTHDHSLIAVKTFPEDFDVAKWMSVMAGEVLLDEIIEVPLP